MNEVIIFNKSKTIGKLILVFSFLLLFGVIQNHIYAQSDNWSAPKSADQLKNPYKGIEKATMAGKQLYTQYCAICHGKKGKGDGVAGMVLKPRPSNFTKATVQDQTDGALYWKLREGKPPMAAYKETLTEDQRWQLVNFIRTLD